MLSSPGSATAQFQVDNKDQYLTIISVIYDLTYSWVSEVVGSTGHVHEFMSVCGHEFMSVCGRPFNCQYTAAKLFFDPVSTSFGNSELLIKVNLSTEVLL